MSTQRKTTAITSSERESIHPGTTVGAVRLDVSDVERMQSFYQQSIGLRALDRTPDLVRLGVDGRPLVELAHRPGAAPRRHGTTGLFHLAILVPSRVDLAQALRRVVDSGWSFSGASDHLVSEALYLDDPEGNGIEIYRDRSRDEWKYAGGQLQMSTLPLDIDGVIGELEGTDGASPTMATETRMGHVHLQVADIAEAEAFYSGVLGFEVTVRGYPGALFVSAGGYHHHLGLNTWAGEGAPPPPSGSRGLNRYEILVPTQAELERLERRLDLQGVESSRQEEGVLVSDPSANKVLLRTT